MSFELDLREYRRLIGLESEPLQEESNEYTHRNAEELIEFSLGLRKQAPKRRKKQTKPKLPKKLPTYRELYKENDSLKRRTERLEEAVGTLTEQVRELSACSQRASKHAYADNSAPWEMSREGAPRIRTRYASGLREFLSHNDIELTDNTPDATLTRARARARRPRTPAPNSDFVSGQTRPEDLSSRPSLFPSFDEPLARPSTDDTPRWMGLDTDEINTPVSPRSLEALPRFENIETEPTPRSSRPKDVAPAPRFEGILDG